MAAPTPTARQTPTGRKLKNGHPSKVTFAGLPAINLWEKASKPPGVDGGDAIEQTTFFNTRYRTKAPRNLLEITDGSMNCAYDPAVLTNLVNHINVEDTVTHAFWDGTTWALFGYMKQADPAEMKEGEQPEIAVTIVYTMADSSGAEQAPVVTSVSGT